MTVPHYKPGVVHPDSENPDPVKRSVYAFRKNQWLEKERALYLSDPSRPLIGPDRPLKPAERENRDAVVQIVEDRNYDIFGFTVVRMDYRDDEAWEKWADAVDESIERAVADCEGGQRIVEKVYLAIADDQERLEGGEFRLAMGYHNTLLEEEKLEPGLQATMILVADKQAVDSLLHPTRGVKPWIWAVDLTYDFGSHTYEIPPADFTSDEYAGFFRVTPEAAFTDLWPLLMSTPPTRSMALLGITGACVWDPTVEIWEGIV